jgi:hypothetical protein
MAKKVHCLHIVQIKTAVVKITSKRGAEGLEQHVGNSRNAQVVRGGEESRNAQVVGGGGKESRASHCDGC